MLSTSTHVFSEIYIHLNWHCAEDRPMIVPRLKAPLCDFIENYCQKTKGIKCFGLNGIENHLHLVIQMEPDICLAEWVGKVKGASSHEMNRKNGMTVLDWQRGYGAVSFAGRDMPSVLKYVANQAEHHQQKTWNPTLENFGQFMEKILAPGEING